MIFLPTSLEEERERSSISFEAMFKLVYHEQHLTMAVCIRWLSSTVSYMCKGGIHSISVLPMWFVVMDEAKLSIRYFISVQAPKIKRVKVKT